MAITQVTTVTVDGVVIGLSDTIGSLIQSGDFTVENLTPYMICGQLNKLCPKYGSITGAERTYSGSAGSLPAQFPNVNTGSVGGDTVEYAQDDSLALSHDMYGRNILIYGSLGTPQIYSITNDMTTSNLRLVTSIDFKKIYYDVDMAGVSVSFTRPDAKTITNYQSGADGKIKTIDNDEDTNINVFSVVDDGENNSWYCLIDDLFPKSNSYAVRWLQSTTQYMSGNYSETYATLNDGWNNFTVDKTLWRWSEPAGYLIYGGDGGNWGESFVGYIENGNNFYAFLNYTPYGGTMQCIADGLEYALNQLANAGLKFKYNNTWYKPIAEGGIITGYTDDMTEESDWDDIVDVTGNTVPVTPTPVPPTPSGDDDDYADMGLGVGVNVGGLTNYAIMSIRDLATLLADFNEHLETGMSIQNNFVCLYKLGPLSSFLCNISMGAIIMSANAKENFVSVEDYAVVSGQKSEHYFGSYNVPRFTNTFYDFSPYSTYELFIPCCGWVPLPDTVAGRTIDVYLIFDLASCTCKGVVRIGGTTVAEVSGVLGSSVPFYMIEHGMERLAQVTAITQTLSSLAVGGVGAASGNAGVAAYGLSQLTQSLNDLNVAGNTNFTAIKGGNSDMSAMGNGEYCTIKITHPVIDEVVNNSMFGHSVGYLCNSIGKLSDFKGFAVCGNPHVTFSASSEEREEIERLLSMGVIL